MTLHRSSRSVVALLTAVLLLLCQTAALAQACVTSSVQGEMTAASIPCHGAAEADSTSGHQPAAPSICDASQALAQAESLTIFPPADLPPLLVVAVDAATAVRGFRSQQHALHNVCSSPPLTVLHCRFLI